MDHPPCSPNLATGCFKKCNSVLKGMHFSDLEDIKSIVEKKMTDFALQDFKNCFVQSPKCWEHFKEFEGEYFENF
jgi:hypothetical protein